MQSPIHRKFSKGRSESVNRFQETGVVQQGGNGAQGPDSAALSVSAEGYKRSTDTTNTVQDIKPSTEPTPRLEFIDGLRALAMLQVLLFH